MTWIPIEERLPKQGVMVLVTIKGGRVAVGYSVGEGRWYEAKWDYIAVTAWMPFPDPYVKGNQ